MADIAALAVVFAGRDAARSLVGAVEAFMVSVANFAERQAVSRLVPQVAEKVPVVTY